MFFFGSSLGAADSADSPREAGEGNASAARIGSFLSPLNWKYNVGVKTTYRMCQSQAVTNPLTVDGGDGWLGMPFDPGKNASADFADLFAARTWRQYLRSLPEQKMPSMPPVITRTLLSLSAPIFSNRSPQFFQCLSIQHINGRAAK